MTLTRFEEEIALSEDSIECKRTSTVDELDILILKFKPNFNNNSFVIFNDNELNTESFDEKTSLGPSQISTSNISTYTLFSNVSNIYNLDSDIINCNNIISKNLTTSTLLTSNIITLYANINIGNIINLNTVSLNTTYIQSEYSNINHVYSSNIYSNTFTSYLNQLDYPPTDNELITKQYFDITLGNVINETISNTAHISSELLSTLQDSNVDIDKIIANVSSFLVTQSFVKTEDLSDYARKDEAIVNAANKSYVDDKILTLESNIHDSFNKLDAIQFNNIVDLTTVENEDFQDSIAISIDEINFAIYVHKGKLLIDNVYVTLNQTIFIKNLNGLTNVYNYDFPSYKILNPEYYNGIYKVTSIEHNKIVLTLLDSFSNYTNIKSSIIHTKSRIEGGFGQRNAGLDFLITHPNHETQAYSFGTSIIQYITLGKQDALDVTRVFSSNLDVHLNSDTDYFKIYSPNDEIFSLSGFGECSANMFTCPSDVTLKNDIKRIKNSSDILNEINGYTFKWNKNPTDKNKQYGFIAQEVEAVLPSLVYTNKQGIKSVDYSKFCAILVENTKEKDNKIFQLERSIKTLQSEFVDLKSTINILASQHNNVSIKNLKVYN